MIKCKGCGIKMQCEFPLKSGYTPDINNKFCQRCFKIRNYNLKDNENKNFTNEEIVEIINKIRVFNFFLCDIFFFNHENLQLFKKINKPKVFVLTKVDLLPNNLDLNLLVKRLSIKYQINNVLLSSENDNSIKKNILKYLDAYQKVLFSGPTSAGKSTLINRLGDFDLTVSPYQNTTRDFISLSANGHTIIDAPGFTNSSDVSKTSRVSIKTVFLKKGYELIILDKVIKAQNDINLSLYVKKELIYKTRKSLINDGEKLNIFGYTDLLINNECFIYFKNACDILVNDLNGFEIRPSLVGGLT